MFNKPKKRKDLMYYHIQYGGMPMTPAGKERFKSAAKYGGYSDKELKEYLKE